MRFPAIGGYQLRDGEGWLGRSLGQILAKACLPMKDWHKPEGLDRWLYAEAIMIGAITIIALGHLLYSGLIGR